MITSLTNPLVKQVRSLRLHKTRRQTGLFIVEGIHHVGEAVEAGWDIDTILYDPSLLVSEYAQKLISPLSSIVQQVSTEVMESLAGKDNPTGLIAIVHQKQVQLDQLPALHSGVALISPQDPGNVGTILRTLDAVGSGALFLLEGGVDPYHPSCVRASMGSLFWRSIVRTTFSDFLAWARDQGYQVISTSAHAALDFEDFTPRSSFILLMGSEQKGLSGEQIGLCDECLSVPMRGRGSSLNLAVAAGILLYHFVRP